MITTKWVMPTIHWDFFNLRVGITISRLLNLKKAAELLPERSRIWFNLYNLFDFKNNITEAQNALNKCFELEPRNIEFLYAKIEFLLKQQREKEAVEVAKKVLEYYPDTQDKKDLQNFIHLNS